MMHHLSFALTILFFVSGSLSAQSLSVTKPEDVGLSGERLDRFTRVIQRNIDEEWLAGCVVLIARQGEVAYLKAAGMQDREAGIPMKPDTIFRIASMSKPITSVAVMMLYEEGRFRLSDPVADYLPAFRNMTVLNNSAEENGNSSESETIRAERPVTIRHLLTHTSGLVYHWNPKLGERYRDAGVTAGLIEDKQTLAQDIPKLGKLPLLHQPGEKWTYGMSVDVLGYLVEVVSGMPFDEFLRERIFEPLKMHDTYFHVPEEKQSRLATAYTVGPEGGLERLGDEPVQGAGALVYSTGYPTSEDHRFHSGGGGLCSTVPDYYRFAQMLLNGGELDGVRLLSPKTVELMTTDHVGDLLENQGFGLGFGVTRSLAEKAELGTTGTYYWGSFWYGTFFIDPAEEMIGISIAQKHPGGKADLNAKFDLLARQAIVE